MKYWEIGDIYAQKADICFIKMVMVSQITPKHMLDSQILLKL